MLQKKQINNYFAKNLKKKFHQYETKRYLLKSIIQNQKIKPYMRAYAFFKLTKLKHNSAISKQFNTCLESGKNKSIINSFNRSRQISKQFGLRNKLPGISVKSW